MGEKNNLLFNNTMFYGLLLGGFWVIKYVFFVLGTLFHPVDFIAVMLAPLTCIFAYIFTKFYKIETGGSITFLNALRFGILLFFFASLIESLPQYIYFRYIVSSEYVDEMVKEADKLADIMKVAPEMKSEMLTKMAAFKPIDFTLQGILTNMMYGIIISIAVGAILCRRKYNSGFLTGSDE